MIRVFGSKDCVACKRLLASLHRDKVAYSYIDADDDKNQDLCDAFEVESLPFVQILAGNQPVHQFVGAHLEPSTMQALDKRANQRK